MILRTEYPNGFFGDPALYVWELNSKRALLLDCGDLSKFATRQLLKVGAIFVSHCHIDHFHGFDHFLRVHVGSDKTVFIFGPPETTKRVAGKLQGYTWNLIYDRNLEFVAVDLDVAKREKHVVHFHARDAFIPSRERTELWNPADPVFSTNTYKVSAVQLDHRTPSMSYCIEEKIAVSVNAGRLREMNLKTGPWVNTLKDCFLAGDFDRHVTAVFKNGEKKEFTVADLSRWLLLPRQRHKIVYATDGAANSANREVLLNFLKDADVFFSETCFLEEDREFADDTKHFTARFIAELSKDAGVKRLVPFHFSKRYMERPGSVLEELGTYYHGTTIIPDMLVAP